jgi:hypothetical protein
MTTADYESEIRHLACRSGAFDEVESLIDSAPLTTDQKAALWLLAWSFQDAPSQRRIAHETLAAAFSPS